MEIGDLFVASDDDILEACKFLKKVENLSVMNDLVTAGCENLIAISFFLRNNANKLYNLVNTHSFVIFYSQYLVLLQNRNLKDYLDNSDVDSGSPFSAAVANLTILHKVVDKQSSLNQDFVRKIRASDVPLQLWSLLKRPELSLALRSKHKKIVNFVSRAFKILLHIIENFPLDRHVFLKAQASQTLIQFFQPGFSDSGALELDGLLSLRTKCILLLSHLLNDEDNKKMNANNLGIEFIQKAISAVLRSSSLSSKLYGTNIAELIMCMSRLAASDTIKAKFVQNNCLPLLQSVLDKVKEIKNEATNDLGSFNINPDEVAAATLQCIWILSFCRDCRLCYDQLQQQIDYFMQNSAWSLECRLAALGIQAVLNFSVKPGISVSIRLPQSRLIAFSYDLRDEILMSGVCIELIRRGYQVWINEMNDKRLENMLKIIPSSAVVIPGISQSFKFNPECRMGIQLAKSYGIPIIPLLLETDFIPEEWLDMALATIIHIPLFELRQVPSVIDKIEPRLKDYLFAASTEIQLNQNSPNGGSRGDTNSSREANSMNCNTIHSNEARTKIEMLQAVEAQYGHWKISDIQNWLEVENLAAFSKKLAHIDGHDLVEMFRLWIFQPDNLDRLLKTDFNMNSADKQQICEALNRLYKH